MGWVALGRCAGGGGRLSSILSLSLTSLASSLIFTSLCILTLAFTLVTLVRAEDMYVLQQVNLCIKIVASLASRSCARNCLFTKIEKFHGFIAEENER